VGYGLLLVYKAVRSSVEPLHHIGELSR
jgi:hypothetical protein